MTTLKLTPTESDLLQLLKKRVSDTRIRAQLGMTQGQLIEVSGSLREKLGVGNNETIREAATRQGV